jgi:hypothetical protein
VTCKDCGAKLRVKRRRYFRGITKRAYQICDECGRAQSHSVEFNPAAGANIDAAAIMYEKFRRTYDRIKLKILVWGPDPRVATPASQKRIEIRDALRKLGHEAFFSEELMFDRTNTVPANLQERVQLEDMDAVICLASDFGPLQEFQEFGLKAREFLGWLSVKARDKYTDVGIAQQLRQAGRLPEFFNDDDLSSCAIAAASAEWVEQKRMTVWAIEQERSRLERMSRKGSKEF